MKPYLELFISFFKVGAFTFGGGYSMIPIVNKEIAQKRKWCSEDEILDFYAVSQCIPGIIAINTSIFIGYKHKGIPGGIVAALGSVMPSLLIILFIATCISNFLDLEYVQYAFSGIRIGVCALVTHTIFEMGKKNIRSYLTAFIFIGAFIASYFFNLSTIALIISFTLIGFGLLQVVKGVK